MTITKLKRLVNKTVETVTLDRIDEYLLTEDRRPRSHKSTPSNSPSSLGSKCLRKLYYQYWRVERDIPNDVKALRIFKTGHVYEDMLMGWLKAVGEHIPYRDASDGKIPLNSRTGEPDPQFQIESADWRVKKGLIDNVAITNGELWIYEIKSSKQEKFDPLKQPMPDHLIQAGIYLKCFNEMLKEGRFKHIRELDGFKHAVGVRYLYINKNTSEIKQFDVKSLHFKAILQKVDDKIKLLDKYLEAKKLPKKTPDYCPWCPFRIKCKNSWNDIL